LPLVVSSLSHGKTPRFDSALLPNLAKHQEAEFRGFWRNIFGRDVSDSGMDWVVVVSYFTLYRMNETPFHRNMQLAYLNFAVPTRTSVIQLNGW
jgi:hypothetical protein